MGQFRKKPVVIEATQWFKNGDHPEDATTPNTTSAGGTVSHGDTEGKVVRFFRSPDDDEKSSDHCKQCEKQFYHHGWIDTLEGGHIVCPGDWIITGVQGERYPCKPDIFEATYEDVDAQETPEPGPLTIMAMRTDAEVMHSQAREIVVLRKKLADLGVPEEDRKPPYLKPDILASLNVVPEWVALTLFAALDDIDTADDLAKGDEGLYRNLVRRYHKERFKVADTDGYKVRFQRATEQPNEVDFTGTFVAGPQYLKRIHALVASMVQHLNRVSKHTREPFEMAWLSTFDDPNQFPEVTKIVEADKS